MFCKLSPMETIPMKCQILFSRKNKQNMTSLSAESALSLVSVEALSKIVADDILIFLFYLFFLKNRLSRGFT